MSIEGDILITYVNGSIFNSPAKVLVNPVNTEGVMGKGLAKEFKSFFPEMFPLYLKVCESGAFTVGKLWLYKTPNKWVLNFPTKSTWRKPSEMEYIASGLQKFVDTYSKVGITSIAFPQLGCGNGELSWDNQVSSLMTAYLSKIPIDVFIHIYQESKILTPEHKTISEMKEWLVTEPYIFAFEELKWDIKSAIVTHQTFLDPLTKRDFTVNVNNESGCIEFDNGFKMPFELLKEIWGTIRRFGYLSRSVVHYSVEDNYGKLLGLLMTLPYCQLVNVSPKYKEIITDDSSIGIQLVPTSSSALKNGNIVNPKADNASQKT